MDTESEFIIMDTESDLDSYALRRVYPQLFFDEAETPFDFELARQVQSAYINRLRCPVVPGTDIPQVLSDEANELGDMIRQLPPETILQTPPPVLPPHIVGVDNPDQYLNLLMVALSKVGFHGSDIQELAERDYIHETEHASPALGNPAVYILYCVSFYENSKTGRPSMIPRTYVWGLPTVGLIKKMFENTSWSSGTDNMVLGAYK